MSETVNVLPVNDIKPHIESAACRCEPSVEVLEGGGRVIVHHSYDGREFFESDEALEEGVRPSPASWE